MAVAGYVRIFDADGNEPFAEIQQNTTETWSVHLTRKTDGGAEADYDVSDANITVRLRISRKGVAAVGVDVLASNVNTGSDGKVNATVRCDEVDFATDLEVVDAGWYIVDTNQADADTISGQVETLWKGLFELTIRERLDTA